MEQLGCPANTKINWVNGAKKHKEILRNQQEKAINAINETAIYYYHH